MFKKIISLICRNRIFIINKSKDYTVGAFYFRGIKHAIFIDNAFDGSEKTIYKRSMIRSFPDYKLLSRKNQDLMNKTSSDIITSNIQLFKHHLESFIKGE